MLSVVVLEYVGNETYLKTGKLPYICMLFIIPQICVIAPEVRILKTMAPTTELDPLPAIACAYSFAATSASSSSFAYCGSFTLIRTRSSFHIGSKSLKNAFTRTNCGLLLSADTTSGYSKSILISSLL